MDSGKKPDFSDPIQLASIIAHQLKAPITSAASILQTLVGGFAGPLNAKQLELINKAVSRCNESLETAQRLLTISASLHNKTEFQGVADLIFLAHKVRLNYQEEAFSRHIDLALDIQINQAQTRGYEPALTEAIEALLHNALKYTPDHGRICLALLPGPQPETICISVADSGIGVPQEEIGHIFEPFTRSHAARKSDRPGTGLGLPFVKAIVEASGGSIDVTRSTFGGAEFRILLPLVPETVPAQGDTPMSDTLKVIIVGGIAAGPKVAAKVVRLNPTAEVTIIDKGKLLSYAGCGLPYYISGIVREQKQLMSSPAGEVRDPVFFQKVKNIHIMNQTEATEIDRRSKKVRVKDLASLQETYLEYDKLVLATGSMPAIPDCQGNHLKNIYSLHGVNDAEGIKTALETGKARDVVIVGGGLIGVEVTEALVQKGCRVTIVEKRNQILIDLDWEMAKLVEHHMEANGVRVLTDTTFESFEGAETVQTVHTSRNSLPADLAILALGIKPNTLLAQQAGLDIGSTGAIKVDPLLRSSDPDIFAAGDCVESVHFITKKPCYEPFGSIANKQGRVVALNICGKQDAFPPALHSVACKIFEYGVARTGLSETEARQHGYDVTTVLTHAPDREHFSPGAKPLMIKLVVDTQTRRLLGAQAVGPGHADKRINIATMAIIAQMTVDQIANLDLCYAPAFSPVMDNLITAANIARNKLDGAMVGITPMELYQKIQDKEDMVLLDVRTHQEYEHERLPNTQHIPLGVLRERMSELPQDKLIVTFCDISLRGYEAALILRAAGFSDVRVLDGGLEMWPYEKIQ